MVKPEKTLPNLSIMGRESARWKATARRFGGLANRRQIEPVVAHRAGFADEVLFAVSENLRLGLPTVLVAQSQDGRVLAAMVYIITPPGSIAGGEGHIHLLAVDPENLTGSPGTKQVRGLGTAMVAAASRIFLKVGAGQVNIHPLDQQAAIFWSGRGFVGCGAGGLMCVRGRAAIEGLINGCVVNPDRGDYILCGLPAQVERMRVPAGVR